MLDSAYCLKLFAALFAIMNPIANVPVFLSLTSGASPARQRQVAITATVGVAVGALFAALAGSAVLRLFGITVDDFRLAGGLLVLLIAISMLHGNTSTQHASTAEETSAIDARASQSAVYPLTVPLLLGPGSIATMILFGHTAVQEGKLVELCLTLGCFVVLLAASMLLAPSIAQRLPASAISIMQRVMGMILAAIAVEMMVSALRAVFPGLAH